MMDQKNYDPKEAEQRIQKFWEQKKVFIFDTKSKKPIFSLDTPPPTVSGKMHMGHAFGNSQQDFIARYKRMQGYNVLQPFGTDDNGLATERLVEKLNNIKGTQMPRNEFTKICLQTLEKIRPEYLNDWKRLGISCDWNIHYSTIDEHARRISQKSFLNLIKKKRIYQKEAPTIWCPECHTAIAQVELEDKEQDSTFNDIKFTLESGKEIIIATTRPELLPACVAIFVHPEDTKNKHLLGEKAITPLFQHKIPILADKRVDKEKGTGIVMCCTFGDQTDIEWYLAHKLQLKMAITRDGKMTELAGKYQGQSLKEARTNILGDLKEKELLVNQRSIKHMVNTHERCGTEVEILNTKQWFIKYLDLKKQFLKIGKELNWYPEYMRNRYDNWIKGLQWDWCISRQRFFGVPFPVWYEKKTGKPIFASEKQLPVDPLKDLPKGYTRNEVIPELDVLDTWATSSLTPTIVKELFKGKPIYRRLVNEPMSLRPQGHDIISFWLFNTVVKSYLEYDMSPWRDCFINGWILDPKGKKMAKSKGNVIEPREMIEKYSADALRYMSASCKLGEDLKFPENFMTTGQKTVTKLWNASKFSIMHLQNYKPKKPAKLETIDQYMLSSLQAVIQSSTESFEKYAYSQAKAGIDQFFWNVFCDFYLEIIKDRLYNPDKRGKQAQASAQYTLFTSLNTLLKLWAPILPFVTEEIYQNFFKKYEKKESIHTTTWPSLQKKSNTKLINMGNEFMNIVKEVRMFKTKQQKSLKEPVKLTLLKKYKQKFDKSLLADLQSTTNATQMKFGNAFEVILDNGQ